MGQTNDAARLGAPRRRTVRCGGGIAGVINRTLLIHIAGDGVPGSGNGVELHPA
jgi:hypothetical protein